MLRNASGVEDDTTDEPTRLFEAPRRSILKAAGASAGGLLSGGTLLGSATAATADGNCVQVDFVSGSSALDLTSSNTYTNSGSQDLVAWQWGETVDNQSANGESGDRGTVTGDNGCSISATSGPTLDFTNYTASVDYDVSGCSGGGTDLMLVSYEAPCNGSPSNPGWDPANADQQQVFDTATTTTQSGGTLTVDIPPLPAGVPERSSAEAYLPLDTTAGTNCITGSDLTTDPHGGSFTTAGGVSGDTNDAYDVTKNYGFSTGSLPINGPDAAVAAWFRFNDFDSSGKVLQVGGTPTSAPTDGYAVEFAGNANEFRRASWNGGSKYDSGSVSVFADTWYFVVAFVGVPSGTGSDDANLHIYDTNGELPNSPVTNPDFESVRGRSGSEPLHLLSGSGAFVDGRIDEVYAFSTEFASDRDTLYNASF